MSFEESSDTSLEAKSSCEPSVNEDVSNENTDDDINNAVYDTSVEPLATEQEHMEYKQRVSMREQEQEKLSARFSGKESTDNWCKCGKCSLQFVVKPEECRCCVEIEECKEKMRDEKMDEYCLTDHPGFDPVCLNPWVLKTAGLSFKTRTKGCKNYTILYTKGKKSESE